MSKMRRLVSTVNLQKEEWLYYRKLGLTGTDAGAICGMNPYVSAFQVFQDKRTTSIELIDSEAMRQGRDLEEYVAQRFMAETGLKVRKANAVFQSIEHPFMLADFDRLVVGQNAGLECKTVSPYNADKWEDEKIPLHYQMQVQHYLAVSGYDCWYVAALIFGREFIVRKIERDEELIQYLITIEKRFWEENVLEGVMPDPDGSKNCSEWITQIYFKAEKEKNIELIGYNKLLDRRMELNELIDKLTNEKSIIDQKIKLEMGDAAYGHTDDYKISWSRFERDQIDTKRLKAERPDIYAEYCNKSSSSNFRITRAA